MGDKSLYHLPAHIYIIQTGHLHSIPAKKPVSLGCNAFFLSGASL